MKLVCQLDANGYFVGTTEADPSPMEPGVYLFPAGTVDAPAPQVPSGTRAKWNGSVFLLEDIPAPPAPDPLTLAQRRDARWEQVKAERKRREDGGVQVSGHWFQTDADSRIKLMRLDQKATVALAGGGTASTVLQVAGQPIAWKTYDNGLVPMTAGLAQGIASSIEILDALAYARGQALYTQIYASSNPEAIDITTGWPPSYTGGA